MEHGCVCQFTLAICCSAARLYVNAPKYPRDSTALSLYVATDCVSPVSYVCICTIGLSTVVNCPSPLGYCSCSLWRHLSWLMRLLPCRERYYLLCPSAFASSLSRRAFRV